jgi:uncharacterized radical SAM superfamily Fe-S cluster-containing enzyme
MDPYNFDLDRTQNCALHFGVIDKEGKPRLIPFCSMNCIHRSALSDGKGELREASLEVVAKAPEQVT